MVARQEEEGENCGSLGIRKKEEEKEERRGLVKVLLVAFAMKRLTQLFLQG